jgi:hypothetical protein
MSYHFNKFGYLSDDELFEIQEVYRRQKIREYLVGPVISTAVHMLLLLVCSVLFVGQGVEPNETVDVTPIQEKVVEEPPPPPPPPEVPPPEPEEIRSHDPQVSSDSVPDAADLVGAIDDVSDEPPSTDDNAELDMVSEVKPSASNLVSAKMFGGRSASGRAGALKSFGGSVSAQQSLHKALAWLAKVQNPDGSWSDLKDRSRPGLTGLALLTFLAHGETPKSKSYGRTVSSAISWLVKDRINKDPYAHAIKTYALSETYAMTGNYAVFEKLGPMVDTLLMGQQPSGGFDYNYKNSAKDEQARQDVSVAGWNYQAMKAAKGAGIEVEGLDEGIQKSIRYLKKLASNSKMGDGFPYNPIVKQTANKHTTRAVGVLCLQLLGEGKAPEMKDELEKIYKVDLVNLKWDKAPKQSLYGWYYATQCMFQEGGKMWKAWNKVFQKELKNNQNPVGYWEFPGDPHGPKSDLAMKIYATTLCSLMLTVYYRYLPMTSKMTTYKVLGKTAEQREQEKAKASGEEEISIF